MRISTRSHEDTKYFLFSKSAFQKYTNGLRKFQQINEHPSVRNAS
jgi:hypothetical protein